MMGSQNVVAQILQALQQADQDYARKQQLGLQREAGGRAERQLRMEEDQAPLRTEQLQQGITVGREQLRHLQLQNDALAQQNKLFDNAESFTEVIGKSVENLGELKPDEKSLITAASQEAKQKRSLAPVTEAIGRIMTQRGISNRQEDAQAEAMKRMLETQKHITDRMFEFLSLRQGKPEEIDDAAKAVTTGQAKLTDFPQAMRAKILRKAQESGLLVLPQKVREDFNKLSSAEATINTFEGILTDFVNDKSTKNALRLANARRAFAIKVGRALGEVGVFTDQDRKSYERMLAPGGVAIAAVDETIAYQSIQDLKDLLSTVRQRTIENYSKSFSRNPSDTSEPEYDPVSGKRVKKP